MAAKTTNGTDTWSISGKTITGGNGVDNIDATQIANVSSDGWTISGANGDDVVKGSQYNDFIFGDDARDTTLGNGADKLYGGDGNDYIRGGNGADTIEGDKGADTLYGDRGGDIFKYVAVTDSNATSAGAFQSTTGDVINDFKASEGDKLDFSALPLTGAGAPDKLTWSDGANGVSHTYGVWSDGSVVYADTNGDGVADLAIKVSGVGGGDFIGVNHTFNDADETAAGTAKDDSVAITGNVLTGTTDPDGDVLKVLQGSTGGTNYTLAHGTLTMYANGDYSYVVADESLKPGVSYPSETFSYTVSDGHGGTNQSTLTIKLEGLNDAPLVSGAVSGSATEDGSSSTLNALANASDVDGDTLTVANIGVLPAGVTYDAGSHSFALDPINAAFQSLAAGQTTTVSVTYDVSDGTVSASTSASWTVTGTNDAPVVSGAVTGTATEDGSTSSVDALANASDVDAGTTLTVLSGSLPDGVSYEAGSHSFTLDPTNAAFQSLAEGQTGTVTVNYQVSDGITSSAASASWTVTGTNDAPVVSGPVSGAATEDGSGSTVNALANASDVDAGTALTVGNVSALPDGVSYDAGSHSFTLDPTNAAFRSLADGTTATVTVTYEVSDGIAPAVATSASWTVTGVNDAPTGSASAVLDGGTEDTAYTVSASTLLQGFSDVDSGDTLSVTGVTADHGTVAFDNGVYTITPEANYNGTVTLSYTVQDNHGSSTAATQGFSLAAVNDAAVISGVSSGGVTEDASPNTVSGNLDSTDVDGTNDLWNATSGNGANSYGTFAITTAGVWTYTLDNANAAVNALNTGQSLSDSFVVSTADGTQQTVSITINGHSDGATLLPVVVSGDPNFGLDPNDFDNFLSFGGSGGTSGDDHLTGNSQTNSVWYGGAGNDVINGNNNDNVLFGGTGNDTLQGNSGNDTIYGGDGSDNIDGSNDADVLIGGYGADTVRGGNVADTFKYLSELDRGDTVVDFARGTDHFDFSAIDANSSTGANDAFVWGGTTATANGVWYSDDAAVGVTIYADTDGDVSTAELWLVASGIHTLAASDFIL